MKSSALPVAKPDSKMSLMAEVKPNQIGEPFSKQPGWQEFGENKERAMWTLANAKGVWGGNEGNPPGGPFPFPPPRVFRVLKHPNRLFHGFFFFWHVLGRENPSTLLERALKFVQLSTR